MTEYARNPKYPNLIIPPRGGRSPNPLGTAKGGPGLAKYISKMTGNGRMLADFLIRVAEGKEPGLKRSERLKAVEILLDRQFGRCVNTSLVANEVRLNQNEPLKIEIIREKNWRDA